jgi:FkbM family methyltransferase
MNLKLIDPFETMVKLTSYENPIIFDVGAYDGYVTHKFLSLFPSSTIFAFEPFKESFVRLQSNFKNHSGVHVFNAGLCDKIGPVNLHCNQLPATNSILKIDSQGKEIWGNEFCDTKEDVECEFSTIDSILESSGLPRIDILKMDVQGSEYLVMQGASESIKHNKIKLIYSEIIVCPSYEDQLRLDNSLSIYYDAGFMLYGIYNINLTDEGRIRQFDAIFTVQE